MTQPKFSLKSFATINGSRLQIVGRVFNPYIPGWNYNLRNGKQFYECVPENLLKE